MEAPFKIITQDYIKSLKFSTAHNSSYMQYVGEY